MGAAGVVSSSMAWTVCSARHGEQLVFKPDVRLHVRALPLRLEEARDVGQ